MDDPIRAEARRRHERHINHPTHRPLSSDYELVGLRGEEELARVFKGKVDLTPRPGGDGKKDLIVALRTGVDSIERFKIDVKCARKAYNLIVEVGHVIPRVIYVLAQYDDAKDAATLFGWEWGYTVLNAPTKDFGYGVINHYIPRSKLRKMAEFAYRIP